MTQIIYGSELSAELKENMRSKVESWVSTGMRTPCLAVILVGDNPASESYVRGKEKACAAVGIQTNTIRLSASITQEELEQVISDCSKDDTVDGILIQLPLPEGFNEDRAIACIDPGKDVDGLHPLNFGKFFMNQPSFVPCTPLGIMELLKRMGCSPKGKHAVVIGRSKLVGTPVARLLQNANATVTICHSHTANLKELTNLADILIVAVGKPKIIDAQYVKEGAYVIDVGVNSVDGHLCGDVDFESVAPKAGAITPVPKGVGPMTICMLLQNTVTAYEKRQGL